MADRRRHSVVLWDNVLIILKNSCKNRKFLQLLFMVRITGIEPARDYH